MGGAASQTEAVQKQTNKQFEPLKLGQAPAQPCQTAQAEAAVDHVLQQISVLAISTDFP